MGAVLGAELVCAVFLVAGPGDARSGPVLAEPTGFAATTMSSPAPATLTMPGGRSAMLIDLGAPSGHALLARIAAELPAAAAAVSDFWGPQWPRTVEIVVAGTAEQFAAVGAGDADTAATATAERIMFSPAAAGMSPDDLRIVLRHELFHYAARPDTAADAPMWLTEGVADYVARPPLISPTMPAVLPTDTELMTPGPQRSAAYDRAWEFASSVAETYGADRLRELYLAAGGHGRRDLDTAVREVLGEDLAALTAGPP
ncbi:peptidase [Mycolicibacterium duvalii]|uniref:Peptidase n=1 Tax=Mycolicibacterium duvalii TaxID=39688 RepID=A0A7I7JW20_9MYCO|nr:peptidase [Mycolicibacterium duvalii]